MAQSAKLYLIPNAIAENTLPGILAPTTLAVLPSIRFFLAEDVRTARRTLSALQIFSSISSLQFDVLDKDTSETNLATLMQPLIDGHHMGVISESGCPGIADPGALAVRFAHRNGFDVVPLSGPSSLFLGLMASGLNGQQFAFHGYLPVRKQEAQVRVRELEVESKKKNQTQIVIETPYRNQALFDLLVQTLAPTTELTIALDLTGSGEKVRTQAVSSWRAGKHAWPKSPAVFLFLAPKTSGAK